jgi:hypothetical protein
MYGSTGSDVSSPSWWWWKNECDSTIFRLITTRSFQRVFSPAIEQQGPKSSNKRATNRRILIRNLLFNYHRTLLTTPANCGSHRETDTTRAQRERGGAHNTRERICGERLPELHRHSAIAFPAFTKLESYDGNNNQIYMYLESTAT